MTQPLQIAGKERKELFLSREQIKEMYLKGEISLATLINCLVPGLICFGVK